MRNRLLSMTVIVLGLCLSLAGLDADAAKVRKVVLQLSDGSSQKQTLVLNVASNLMRHYGPDNVKIEIVTFGPGLRLLFKNNVNKIRVQSLSASGIRFSACQNTVRKMSKILGHKPALSAESVPVKAGIARILELTERGYTLVRP